MTSDKCSYGKFYERLQLQLNKCQQFPNCKNLLHHTCQVTCEEKHGYEGKINLRCKDSNLNDTNLNRSNVNSCKFMSEGIPVHN